MTVIRLLVAVYVILLGLAVATHFLANQFYDPMVEGTALNVWRILDPMMVSGAIIALIVAFSRKLGHSGDPYGEGITRDYLEANFTFYFSAAVLLALIWNWFGTEWVEPSNSAGLVWIFIDSTLPLLLISTGIRLLREE